jgi:hypothetical protein
MLLIFSEHCNENAYIRRELTVAGESQKLIIPFRVKDAKPQGGLRIRLSDPHWIDGFASGLRAIDEVVTALDPGSTTLPKTPLSKKAIGRRSVARDVTPFIIGAGVGALFILGALMALQSPIKLFATLNALMPGAEHEKAADSNAVMGMLQGQDARVLELERDIKGLRSQIADLKVQLASFGVNGATPGTVAVMRDVQQRLPFADPQIESILGDPAITVEDKIVLFRMAVMKKLDDDITEQNAPRGCAAGRPVNGSSVDRPRDDET